MTEYFRRFDIKCKTLLHIGAHYGEEDRLYYEFDVEPIYVEACPLIFQKLKRKMAHRKLHNVAVSDKPGKAEFFIADNDGFSSSLLKFDHHKKIYPQCSYINKIEVDCTTVDLLVQENGYNIDAMCLDIQGAELMAFKGATETLKNVNIIYVEIALVPLYENSPILPDLDEYLDTFDFKRILVNLEEPEWGDALYVKKDFLKNIRHNLTFDPDPRKIIQLSGLGQQRLGGFGNQLFQYATAKGYCQTYGYTLEIPENWIGREIFKNINDNTIKEPLPSHTANQPPCGIYNVDFESIFWFSQSGVSLFTRQQAKQWFEFKDKYKIEPDRDKKIVAHLRRGDFTYHKHLYAVVQKICYKEAVAELGYNYEDVCFVQENFCTPRYKAWAGHDPYNFLYDFQTIQNADVIFRANSTFSWWAAVLSNAKVFSPVVGKKLGWRNDLQFTKGNHPSIAYQRDRQCDLYSDMYLYED